MQGCIYLIKNTVIKYDYNFSELFSIWIYLKNIIYFNYVKTEFSAAITPVFSVTWSFKSNIAAE